MNIGEIGTKYAMITRIDAVLQEIRESPEPLKTGITSLDRVLGGGMRPGLFVLGAEPGIGKSTLSLQIADNMARGGTDVLLFELEMSASELLAKSLSREAFLAKVEGSGAETKQKTRRSGSQKPEIVDVSDVPGATEILLGNCMDDSLFLEAVKRYREYSEHLHIVDDFTNGAKTKDILDAMRNFAQTKQRSVIVIDYIQLLSIEGDKTLREGLNEAVLELKQASRELRLPVLVISAMNRQSYNTTNLSSFRETSGLEYTADGCWILKEEKDGGWDEVSLCSQLELAIVKNRFSPRNQKINLSFYAGHGLFVDGGIQAGGIVAPTRDKKGE